jgi:histidinol-phosphatase (PHP family)
VLDYHLHLWPHGERHRTMTIEELAAYCDAARKEGVTEIAVTEHLFRFVQADATLRGFWEDDTANPHLQEQASEYWQEHNGADLDAYVDTVLAAKDAGLPIVLGLEVDYYEGRMDKVRALLDDYPFDVLLGSVHWIGAWMFDVLDSDVAQDEWDRRGIARAWDAYTRAIEELSASGAVDVLAHPDLCKVANRRPSTPEEFYDRIAAAAASSNLAAEVSSAGWRKPCAEPYPAPPLLQRFRALDVPITTASDAHSHDLVAYRVSDLRPLLRDAGYTDLAAFSARDHQPVPI